MNRKNQLPPNEIAYKIRSGHLPSLSRMITRVESNRLEDQNYANEVLNELLPYTGNSLRIGISGIPGSGKSTFMEAFGTKLCEQGIKIAVLAIDPSSPYSGGSILGDSTRMEKLTQHPNAFVRPSPSNGRHGGLHSKTFETMLLCEAAGYDIVFIETVGVGQSEGEVRELVDFFMLLTIARSGDDLQGIKRGILELVDYIIVNKCDGELIRESKQTAISLKHSLQLIKPPTKEWSQRVITCSSINGNGLDQIQNDINQFYDHIKQNDFLSQRRVDQKKNWFHRSIKETILHSIYSDETVRNILKDQEMKFLNNEIGLSEASKKVLNGIYR
jgi:LAO/AO transport system kinase